MLTSSTNLLGIFGCCTIIISLYFIIIHRMNYKKKYVNSLNNLKKKRIRFIYLGKQFKKKNCPLKVLKLHLQN